MEWDLGFEHIREPDALLPTGAVVQTHTHNYHHNTHLTLGLWEVHRFVPIVDETGVQMKNPEGEGMWHELPLYTLQGGGPRSVIPIPANMRHKFVLLEGPGFYRCVFAHRNIDGNVCEVTEHYTSAYV